MQRSSDADRQCCFANRHRHQPDRSTRSRHAVRTGGPLAEVILALTPMPADAGGTRKCSVANGLPKVHRHRPDLSNRSRHAVRTGGPPAEVILELTPMPADCQWHTSGWQSCRLASQHERQIEGALRAGSKRLRNQGLASRAGLRTRRLRWPVSIRCSRSRRSFRRAQYRHDRGIGDQFTLRYFHLDFAMRTNTFPTRVFFLDFQVVAIFTGNTNCHAFSPLPFLSEQISHRFSASLLHRPVLLSTGQDAILVVPCRVPTHQTRSRFAVSTQK